jgi:hypothetical protein
MKEMLGTYHRITLNGQTFFREYDESMDSYDDELLSEEEFVEMVMNEFVSEERDIDESKIQSAIRRIPNFNDRELIEVYIRYLERFSNS